MNPTKNKTKRDVYLCWGSEREKDELSVYQHAGLNRVNFLGKLREILTNSKIQNFFNSLLQR